MLGLQKKPSKPSQNQPLPSLTIEDPNTEDFLSCLALVKGYMGLWSLFECA
jgi:hypothetical protein